MPRALVLLGSGETSPAMVTPHQRIFKDISTKGGAAIVLDTTYGFQENAAELTERIQLFFKSSVGRDTSSVQLRSKADTPASIARAIDAINGAEWIFAGPGSPTYALRTWKETGAGDALRKFSDRATLVLSSAAALTIGKLTMPVYEMYKVGAEPHWVDGLDVLGRSTGLSAAVIPHYNNAEGGTHDTRFCYIGEKRIRQLESQLPEGVFILGIDEHTGVRFDNDRNMAEVFGRGSMTIRVNGQEWRIPSNSEISIAEIADHAGTKLISAPDVQESSLEIENVSMMLESGNVVDAVEALLNLDKVERDIETRAQVHALITRLGHLAAQPKIDIAEIVGPYIDALLAARESARKQGNWGDADAIRDKLIQLHVSIEDSKDGSRWRIASE